MSTVANTLRDRVRLALQDEALADVAEISPDEWAQAEEDGGHVFEIDGGFIRGRNRGRIPFLEFEIATQDFKQLSVGGGMVSSEIRVIAHVKGTGSSDAMELASDLLTAAVAAIRGIDDSYCSPGSERYGSFKPGPWGHRLDVTLEVTHSFGRAS